MAIRLFKTLITRRNALEHMVLVTRGTGADNWILREKRLNAKEILMAYYNHQKDEFIRFLRKKTMGIDGHFPQKPRVEINAKIVDTLLFNLTYKNDEERIGKILESSNRNCSCSGDIIFDIVIAGGYGQPATIMLDGEIHGYSILDCVPKREAILPSVMYIQEILRRSPCLTENLENMTRKIFQCLELYRDDKRKKLAIFAALAFSRKLSGLSPETVFHPLLKDNLVANGLVLSFITDFLKEYLKENSVDDFVALLKRAKLEDNLLDFFSPAKRSAEAFSEHFTKEGLMVLVEYNKKKIFEAKLKEMNLALTIQIAENADIFKVIETAKLHVESAKLPDIEVVGILWDILMGVVKWSKNNQQHNANVALLQVKTWAKLLNAFCTNGKLELELMYNVQIWCYEDAKLMEIFPEIVRSLYEQDVLAKDTILLWFHKGANPMGRQTLVKALEPFVKGLMGS